MTVNPESCSGSDLAKRVDYWQLRTRRLAFPRRPLLMGIVNVTPDSFSDGGQFFQTNRAVEQALHLASHGADLIDIGGESTRPYSEAVSLGEELDRVVPVVEEIRAREDVIISVDTSKSEVARECLNGGAEIINDVTGLCADEAMASLVAETRAGVCLMHMQGTPQTMQDSPSYEDVVQEVYNFLRQRRDALVEAGIELDSICLDPGIGFGKTTLHNCELLQHIETFHRLGHPLLVGHSRKGFIGKLIEAESSGQTIDREAGTLGVSLAMAHRGVQILRLHEPEYTRQALILFEAAGSVVADC